MPSPNGYFDCGATTNIARNWWRHQITHNVNAAPWDTPNAGSYEFEFNVGTAAGGPFTPAVLTSPGSQCSPTGVNTTSPGGLTETLVGIGGPAALLADTDYWVEIILRDPDAVEVDRFVCGPVHTEAYPTFTCLAGPVTQTTGQGGMGNVSGQVNIDGACNTDSIVWEIGTAPGGPYTPTAPAPVTSFSPTHTFTGLAPSTQYYYRARLSEQAQTAGEYLVTQECTFTTSDVVVPPVGSPFQPLPCDAGGGGGEPGADVEQNLLCDVMPDGQVVGTALAVWEYDADGNPAGPPTFVNPATGAPYVAQGVLQPCPGEVGCAPPTQFCFTSTASGPVEHPGRMYDITLPINPGFAVDSLQIDATNYPANLTWSVTDPDGEQFRPALQSFLAARFPGQTVTVTNPNAGSPVCGLAIPMTIHIECVRVDAPAPDLVELIYNGGRDLVVNPAYLTTPPTNLNGPQFVYLRRQDAGGTLNCTNVANQGWETNDLGDGNRDFELWGQGPGGLQQQEAATPTPRGTPIQEITADINDTGTGPTIWQTFTVPAAGTFKAVMVHGARDNGEQHKITLSTGDTNDNQVGDIINNVTNPPQVTNAGGNSPGPWTTFSQDVALGAGQYTFAISTTNPVGANRGGLFTDMRVYLDAPDQHAAAVTDDETCTITTEETTTTTTCEYWQPRCSNGEIVAWVNVADGTELANAAFWGQAPAPSCCLPEAAGGEGGTVTPGNLIHTYQVCAVVGGVPTTLQRVVITDQSGGVMAQTFVGPDGGPVSVTDYEIGACGETPVVGEFILCDDNGPFVRKLIQSAAGLVTSVVNVTLGGVPYVPVGTVAECPECVPVVLGEVCVASTDFPGAALPAVAVKACDDTVTYINTDTGAPWPNTTGVVICPPDNTMWSEILCDAGNGGTQFRRVWNVTPLGSVVLYDETLTSTPYVVVGPVTACGATGRDAEIFALCDANGTQFVRRYLYDAETGAPLGFVDRDLNGAGFAPVDPIGLCRDRRDAEVEVLCDANGTQFVRTYSYDPTTGTFLGFVDRDLNGVGFAPVDPVGKCRDRQDLETQIICDNNGVPFLRRYSYDVANGGFLGFVDRDLNGLPYVPAEPVGVCGDAPQVVRDSESFVLCSSTPAPGTQFIRTRVYNELGAVVATVDTTLGGAPFVPGVVSVCTQAVATDFDFVVQTLCDANGTAFFRRLTFNSATGAVTSTTDTTLAGAAFVPVGAVGLCSNCCPQVVGNGCTNVGSGFYTAVRSTAGVVSLIDSVTGAAVAAAAIVACPSDNVVRTLTAQARLVGDADAPWTPGTDVVGTLTSVTMTVLSGTATLSDQNGTMAAGLPAGVTATWSVEDDNTLTGPTSIDAVGGSTFVYWTQR